MIYAFLILGVLVPSLGFGETLYTEIKKGVQNVETKLLNRYTESSPANLRKGEEILKTNSDMTKHAGLAKRALVNHDRHLSSPAYAPGFHTDVKLLACSYYNDNSRKHPTGMYYINGDGQLTVVHKSSEIKPQSGAWIVNDEYHYYRGFISYGNFYAEHVAYDMNTWEEINEEYEEFDGSGYSTTVAYNPADGLLYGCISNDASANSFSFAKIDLTTHTKTKIKGIEYKYEWHAMFFDENNTLYVIDNFGDLYTADLDNGDMHFVNHTGQVPQYSAGIGYDPRGKRAYWAISTDDEGYLTELNPATGLTQTMFSFPYNDEIMGICVIQPTTAPETPQMVNGLSAAFPDGSLSGNVSFTLPSLTVGGTAIDSELQYRIDLNGTTAASGSAQPGTKLNVSVVAPEDDFYDISVYVSNEAGENVPDMLSVYIGHDTPRHPDNVVIDWNDGFYNISWNAPTKSFYNGYIDYNSLSYTITRLPDNVVVAENVTSNSFADNVPVPDNMIKYQYTVQTVYDGRISEPCYSNAHALGAIVPPYLNTFDDETDLVGWTILNVNDDGPLEWQWKEREGNGLVYIPCNWQWSMDDWLVSPAVRLEAGKSYELTFDAWTGDMNEIFEFFMGTAPDVQHLNIELIPPTSFYSSVPQPFTVLVSPETTGNYYFGIHGISPAYTYWINFDNFAISAPLSDSAPGEVSEINIVPDSQGALSAQVSFKAPSRNFNDTEDLTSLTRIEVMRDGNLIKTFENPEIGGYLSFEDEVEYEGGYVYGFVAYNEAGHGQSTSASVYIGINYPSQPINLIGYETNHVGEVTLSWEAPLTDVNDYPINPDIITYNIVEITPDNQYLDIANGLHELSYTFQAVSPETPQTFKQYAVFSATSKGEGFGASTGALLTGCPDSTPYSETFRNGVTSHIFGYKPLTQGNAPWSIVKDTNLSISDFNNDHGCVIMDSDRRLNESSLLFTGRIKLNLQNPSLSLYTYNCGDMYTPDNNEIEIAVSKDGGRSFTSVEKVTISQLGTPSGKWARITAGLGTYAGESVIIGIIGTTRNYPQIYLDNIEVNEGFDHDVALSQISAPVQKKINEIFNVSMNLVNNGAQTANGVSVTLYRNDEIHAVKENIALAPGESMKVLFEDILTPMDEEIVYHAVAGYDADMYTGNNTSAEITVTPFISYAPMVDNLNYSQNGNGVALTWEAPIIPEKQIINEDFESYEPWLTDNIGDWTLIDGDGANTGTISSISLPVSGPLSYWVMDSTDPAFSEVADIFAAHSGNKYISQMFPIDIYGMSSIAANDWIISPKLSGEKQTISFYSRSVTSSNPDSFEMLYSTSGIDIYDFTLADKVEGTSNQWTNYTFEIPDGAQYFAIRCTTRKGFMFFIDDISYEINPNYELVGYNVYKNGIKLTEEPIEDLTYTDTHNAGGNYGVSAVYASEESKAAIVYAPSAVNEVVYNNTFINIENNSVVVKTPVEMPVCIFTIDGRLLYRVNVNGYTRIPLETGIYIVEAGIKKCKAIIL